MAHICEWRTPCNHKDVQHFLGLVQYLLHFMPDIAAYTSPLSAICRNGQPFYWKPLHKVCFKNMKAIACKSLILKPIDPMCTNPIWVICDASTSGIGMMYGQGAEWQTCQPASFMSKKFTSAQMNYRVFEMEMITILEALLKWEDKLLGQRLQIITDHKALEFFKTQHRLNSRQVHWMEFLTQFDFEIIYIKGESNLVADALSQYYESDLWNEQPDATQYVNVDSWLDPKGEDLPWDRFEESHTMHTTGNEPLNISCPQRRQCAPKRPNDLVTYVPKRDLIEVVELHQTEAAELAVHKEPDPCPQATEQPSKTAQDDPRVVDSLNYHSDLHPRVEGD
jgi:RNase H-like domain found in reverse transcriptase